MTRRGGSLKRVWDEFVGPEATATNHVLTAAASTVGALAAAKITRRRGGGLAAEVAATVMAADLVGGTYVNNTRACARWYERPGQGDRDHVGFAALHVHPAVVAWLDRGSGRRVPGAFWAAAHYAYMMFATVAVRKARSRRRTLGVLLTMGGLTLDRVLGPSRTAPWFAWTYYPKLLLGHAAASLWSDDELRSGRVAVQFRVDA